MQVCVRAERALRSQAHSSSAVAERVNAQQKHLLLRLCGLLTTNTDTRLIIHQHKILSFLLLFTCLTYLSPNQDLVFKSEANLLGPQLTHWAIHYGLETWVAQDWSYTHRACVHRAERIKSFFPYVIQLLLLANPSKKTRNTIKAPHESVCIM